MGDKKGKSLAMKLIDDLLDDEEELTSPGQQQIKPEDIDVGGEEPTGASFIIPDERSVVAVEPIDLEISAMVKIPEEPKQKVATNRAAPAPAAPVAKKAVILTKEQLAKDETLRLNDSIIAVQPKLTDRFTAHSQHNQQTAQNKVETEKASVGRYSPLRSGGFSSATEASLATSENLRIAQNRILELEQELSRLRTNNEQLAAAGETLRRRADELFAQTSGLQDRLARTVDNKDQEIEILRQSQSQKDKEVGILRLKIEELEMRLSTNIQKIRVRERELENRLELGKMESSALVRSKDEIILDLKRQLDQLNMELENYRNKGHELNKQINDKQEMLRRTVKALRIALSMLEGDDEDAQKKAK